MWGFIGGTDGVIVGTDGLLGDIDGIKGRIGALICGIGCVKEGMSVVLGVIDGVVGGIWDGVWGVWGFIEGSDGMGGIDIVLGDPGLSWRFSGRMKVSQTTAPGPPSCLVVIRQLCRKLTGSSG